MPHSLLTASRSLRRNRLHAVINVAGLSVGLAACLLIFLVIRYEMSFDRFHSKGDRVFRLVREGHGGNDKDYRTGVPFPVAATLRANYPQLDAVAAIMGDNNVQVLVKDAGGNTVKKFKQNNVYVAEPEFFKIFDFRVLQGNPATVLAEPNSVMLSKATATLYFGDWQKAIGSTLRFYGADMKVNGIIADVPENSDFPLEIVFSYSTLRKRLRPDDWGSIADANYCFVLLREGVTPAAFSPALSGFTRKFITPVNDSYELMMQPLKEIHFDDRLGNYRSRTFSHEMITAMAVIAVFLLLIACVNFINLATAQAVLRSKEVGVRKVLGSRKVDLLWQFLAEAALVTSIALVLSVLVALFALPWLSQVLGTHLPTDFWRQPVILSFLLLLLPVVTLLAGGYPAFVLSRFDPVTAFRKKLSAVGESGIGLRRGLVLFQFAIAQGLIICLLVVVAQMKYFRRADPGFNRAAVITAQIPQDSLSRTRFAVLKESLLSVPGVQSLAFSGFPPVNGGHSYSDFQRPAGSDPKPMVVNVQRTDSNYFRLYGIALVAGRTAVARDSVREYLINETLCTEAGFKTPEAALNQKVKVEGDAGTIVGVVKNFHVGSFRDKLDPMVLMPDKNGYGIANIRLAAGSDLNTIKAVGEVWNRLYPDFVFTYDFVDQVVANYYEQETNLSKLYAVFAGVAIFLSCLGLYGLISFMAVRRTREIGVRRVLGASVVQIVVLMGREFTLLVSIACLIAGPLAWFFMHRWLEQYAYRISPGIGIFALAFFGSLAIAWVTVGHRAFRAASVNPAKSLRAE